jgi:hypothetical protein
MLISDYLREIWYRYEILIFVMKSVYFKAYTTLTKLESSGKNLDPIIRSIINYSCLSQWEHIYVSNFFN